MVGRSGSSFSEISGPFTPDWPAALRRCASSAGSRLRRVGRSTSSSLLVVLVVDAVSAGRFSFGRSESLVSDLVESGLDVSEVFAGVLALVSSEDFVPRCGRVLSPVELMEASCLEGCRVATFVLEGGAKLPKPYQPLAPVSATTFVKDGMLRA